MCCIRKCTYFLRLVSLRIKIFFGPFQLLVILAAKRAADLHVLKQCDDLLVVFVSDKGLLIASYSQVANRMCAFYK